MMWMCQLHGLLQLHKTGHSQPEQSTHLENVQYPGESKPDILSSVHRNDSVLVKWVLTLRSSGKYGENRGNHESNTAKQKTVVTRLLSSGIKQITFKAT